MKYICALIIAIFFLNTARAQKGNLLVHLNSFAKKSLSYKVVLVKNGATIDQKSFPEDDFVAHFDSLDPGYYTLKLYDDTILLQQQNLIEIINRKKTEIYFEI